MKVKRLYIAPAMRAHKLKVTTSLMAGSDITTNNTPDTSESGDHDCTKSARFSYDGFGTKSDESSSDLWK